MKNKMKKPDKERYLLVEALRNLHALSFNELRGGHKFESYVGFEHLLFLILLTLRRSCRLDGVQTVLGVLRRDETH